MNKDIQNSIENKLEQWATWYIKSGDYGLGYPSKAVEARIMEHDVYCRTAGPKYLPSNETAEEIEVLITEMFKQTPKIALALREEYFSRGTLPQKAKNIGVSRSQFKVCVDMAKQWLAGRLSRNNV